MITFAAFCLNLKIRDGADRSYRTCKCSGSTEDGLDPPAWLLHIFNMSQDPKTIPSPKPRVPFFHHITMAAALLGVFLLWRQQDAYRNQIRIMALQNASLQQELKKAKAEIDDFNSGDSSSKPREQLAEVRTATKPAPAKEEIETLFLKNPTVEQVANGLVARFRFEPGNDSELPETITIVVRMPANTESKILSLNPVSEADYSNIMHVVNAKGDLGLIEGSPSDLGALAFELTVSAPAKAIVRGSEGIKDFELDITPDGCNVRQL